MKTSLKQCGVCLKDKVIWKAKTRDTPRMCKDCYQHQPKKSIVEQMVSHVQEIDLALLKQRKLKEDKSIPELIKLATIVFNKWIRKRDSSGSVFKCISCQEIKHISFMHAGHYFPAGSNSAIRFNEYNVNGECSECNCFEDDHMTDYGINLQQKIGTEALEELNILRQKSHKWTKEELLKIISKYK